MAHTQAARREPSSSAATISAVERPGSAGSEATPQASARRCRASASVDQVAARQHVRRDAHGHQALDVAGAERQRDAARAGEVVEQRLQLDDGGAGAGEVVGGAERGADDGRPHVDQLAGDGPDGGGVHADVVGDALGQDGGEHGLELALVRQRLAGVAAPGQLVGQQHRDDAVEHLGKGRRLHGDAHRGGVAEVAVARVEHHEVGAVADGAAQGGAGHGVVGHGAVADHEHGARLLEHRQGAGGVAHAGARPRARQRDARGLDGAVVEVVGAEHGAEELLRLVGLFVGAQRAR